LNVVHICLLEKIESVWPLRIYRLIQRPIVEEIITACAAMQIVLSFWKPETSARMQENGVSFSIMILEGCCLAIEFVYIASRFLTKYIWIRFGSTQLGRISPYNSILRIRLKDVYLGIMFLVVFVDWILMGFKDGYVSIEYFVPIRALLHVVLSSGCWASLKLFIRTCANARSSFAMYAQFVLVIGCFCLALFRQRINTDRIISSFDNIVRSLTSCFIFLSSSSNFSEVLYPLVHISGFFGGIIWAVCAGRNFRHARHHDRDLSDGI
jgi:hypothetical protein